MSKLVKAWFFGRSFGKTVLSGRFFSSACHGNEGFHFHPSLVLVDSSDCFLYWS